MNKNSILKLIVPVLPSADINRDVKWYHKQTGFTEVYADDCYAVLKRDDIYIHLQWHVGTVDDPLIGGSVIRIAVNSIQGIYEDFVKRDTVRPEKLILGTAWNTNEFDFFDLNNNTIFIVEALD